MDFCDGYGQQQWTENGRYERGNFKRTMPMSRAIIVGDKANIFDGNEATFGAWKGRVQNKLKLLHTLWRTLVEEAYYEPATGVTPVQENQGKEKLQKRLYEIVMLVNNEVLNKLIGLSNAKEAMDVLVKKLRESGYGGDGKHAGKVILDQYDRVGVRKDVVRPESLNKRKSMPY